MKTVTYTISSIRALRRLGGDAAALVLVNIEQYAADPASLKENVTKLRGRDGYRLRIADRRVIFDENDGVVAILEIGPPDGMILEGRHA
jgi:mRNA interferase RelE/StbE